MTLEAPILLPGATVPGPLDTGSWSITDLTVARVPGAAELVAGLPWSVVAGVQTGERNAGDANGLDRGLDTGSSRLGARHQEVDPGHAGKRDRAMVPGAEEHHVGRKR